MLSFSKWIESKNDDLDKAGDGYDSLSELSKKVIDHAVEKYAALRSQQLEGLLEDFLRVLGTGLSIQPNSALHHCLRDTIINTATI